MGRKNTDKQRLKRKVKKKQKQKANTAAARSEKLEYLIFEADRYQWTRQFPKALVSLKKALRLAPANTDLLRQLAYLGYRMDRPDVELEGCDKLYALGELEDENLPAYGQRLYEAERYSEAVAIAEAALSLISRRKMKNKRGIKAFLMNLHRLASNKIVIQNFNELTARQTKHVTAGSPDPAQTGAGKTSGRVSPVEQKDALPRQPAPAGALPEVSVLPEIPVTIDVDMNPFLHAWGRSVSAKPEQYALAMDGYRLRLNESFDELVCLGALNEVRSLWYQEETAKKVMKRFRGRALLADEVGLGKTIEALIVFSEYYRRGMIKSGLILTPAPLVSQWREELKSKFKLDVPSTDDADYRKKGDSFWQAPFVLASINQAKTKKNYQLVTDREYDIVIVDEAHHLKNRSTLNWRLVNALKKKYLLMLTATPVENNLMELYNLITLLKPGQLKTASAFRKEFMTRGDPTDPQNKEQLRGLLGAVMIRNTRALANIDIPPRFAQTILIQATKAERELYLRITDLVRRLNADGASHRKLLLKNLLAEAGSSPQAVSMTLTRLLAKRDFLLSEEKEIQAINNLCRTMDVTRKNKALLNLIKANPGKLIIFVKYLGTLDHLEAFLEWERIPHAIFHGGLNNLEKDRQIDAFRQEKDILLTTEIGGEGRNLQFCQKMVNYDLPWNPMKIEQRIGRIHRFGQEKEVTIFNFCNAGSVEEHILNILDKKINMFEMVIGEIDMILGRIRGEQEFSDMVFDIWVNAATEAEREASFDQLGARLKRSKASYRKTKQLDADLFGENYEL